MKSIVAPNAQRIVLILAIASIAAVPAIAKEGNWKLTPIIRRRGSCWARTCSTLASLVWAAT